MPVDPPWRSLHHHVVVSAAVPAVWDAWTTAEGIRSFFAPACNVEFRVGGPYEIFFDPDAQPGERGAEGARILAIQPPRMFAFTWNAPTHLSHVRSQFTHVQVWIQPHPKGSRVTVVHAGWGEGEQWDEAFAYFDRAWGEIVLPRLKIRFERGPFDWTESQGS